MRPCGCEIDPVVFGHEHTFLTFAERMQRRLAARWHPLAQPPQPELD